MVKGHINKAWPAEQKTFFVIPSLKIDISLFYIIYVTFISIIANIVRFCHKMKLKWVELVVGDVGLSVRLTKHGKFQEVSDDKLGWNYQSIDNLKKTKLLDFYCSGF